MKIIHRLELTQEELPILIDYAVSQRKKYGYELTDTFTLMSRDPVIYVFEFTLKEEKL